jgi:hypothetical protein
LNEELGEAHLVGRATCVNNIPSSDMLIAIAAYSSPNLALKRSYVVEVVEVVEANNC